MFMLYVYVIFLAFWKLFFNITEVQQTSYKIIDLYLEQCQDHERQRKAGERLQLEGGWRDMRAKHKQ